jgi:hypothetical protein
MISLWVTSPRLELSFSSAGYLRNRDHPGLLYPATCVIVNYQDRAGGARVDTSAYRQSDHIPAIMEAESSSKQLRAVAPQTHLALSNLIHHNSNHEPPHSAWRNRHLLQRDAQRGV